jgi:hypothetical protein
MSRRLPSHHRSADAIAGFGGRQPQMDADCDRLQYCNSGKQYSIPALQDDTAALQYDKPALQYDKPAKSYCKPGL